MQETPKIFTLLDVLKSVQKTLSERYTSAFWVKAEMNKLNFYRQSGHCYPDLVEKAEGKTIAQTRANLWKEDYNRINAKFLATLNEPLKEGIKVLLLAKISFDPIYGLSLRILDMDPGYTLGDLEREKKETIDQLTREGIFQRNKFRPIALLPQRIAIVSDSTSKGYADFMQVLEGNEWNYRFFTMLFPSQLQGDQAVQGITRQLRAIEKVKHHFDAVAIIRGGGGDVGLSCYNHYALSKEIAGFPLPVLTGIGHSTNETVAEMVSFYNAITPTKLAEFLLQQFHNFSVPLQEAENNIRIRAQQLLMREKTRFAAETKLFRSVYKNVLQQNQYLLKQQANSLQIQAVFYCKKEQEKLLLQMQDTRKNSRRFTLLTKSDLDRAEKNIRNLSPENTLKRGYSITLINGKAISSSTAVSAGQTITTLLHEGIIESTVSTTQQTPQP